MNCVCPGTTDTPWIDRPLKQAGDPVAERAALTARQPYGRLVKCEGVAAAIAYLASPAAGANTGVSTDVDGGFSALRVPAPDAHDDALMSLNVLRCGLPGGCLDGSRRFRLVRLL